MSAGPPASSSTLHIRKGRPASSSAPPVASIPSRRAYQPAGNGGLVVDSPGMRNASGSTASAAKARYGEVGGGTGPSSSVEGTGTASGTCVGGGAVGASVGPISGLGSGNVNGNGTGGPVIQRMINAAGQPRKVVVAVGQDQPSGREVHGRRKSLPARSPLRSSQET